jgi:hypothetical protein
MMVAHLDGVERYSRYTVVILDSRIAMKLNFACSTT